MSNQRGLMTLAAVLLSLAASATPARADSPFSIVFGLDQQHRPAFQIQAFGPRSGKKLFNIDSINNSGRSTLYTEFKPPASALAPSPVVAATSKQSRAAAMLNGTLHLLRAITGHH